MSAAPRLPGLLMGPCRVSVVFGLLVCFASLSGFWASVVPHLPQCLVPRRPASARVGSCLPVSPVSPLLSSALLAPRCSARIASDRLLGPSAPGSAVLRFGGRQLHFCWWLPMSSARSLHPRCCSLPPAVVPAAASVPHPPIELVLLPPPITASVSVPLHVHRRL